MRSSRPYIVLASVVFGTFCVGFIIRSIWSSDTWVNEPLHSSIEALGGLAAIAMAFVLFASTRGQANQKASTIAIGFLGMGLLEVFHAVAPSGHAFVLLRNAASLIGSLGFALAFLPRLPARLGRWTSVPGIVIVGALVIGFWSLMLPQQVPIMTKEGEFSARAIGASAVAALLFLTGAVGFISDYRRSGKPESYLLACLALLFATAEMMFLQSRPWNSDWWFWHITRFTAYILVLAYVSRGYAMMIADLRRALEQTRRSERRMAAQYEVTRVLAEATTLKDALQRILHAIGQSLDWHLGIFWKLDEQAAVLRFVDIWHVPSVHAEAFEADSSGRTFVSGIGLPGRVWASGTSAWIRDVCEDPNFPRIPSAAKVGFHGAFAFPIRTVEHFYGVIEFFSPEVREPDREMLSMVGDIGIKMGQFLERKQTEDALRETEALLAEEAKLAEVARLTGDIGHDLKNLLTPVLLGASHVQQELEECENNLPHLDAGKTRAMLEQSKEVLVMIRTSARRIQDRVREIADSVKGLSSPPIFNRCRVSDIVTEVFGTLRILADEQGVSLRVEHLTSLPPVLADETRLFHAFYNLVNNAIAEVPRGGSITISGRPDPDGKHVRLSVADTGRGMPPEVRETLFSTLR